MIKKVLKQLEAYSISVLIILIITPIFTESFGICIFSNQDFKNESRLFYLISNLIGQILYPIFSSLGKGSIIIPCFEGMKISNEIFQSISEHENAIGITSFCLILACAISSLGGILIYFTKTGVLLSRIPRNIVDTMMIATGILTVLTGTSNFYDKNHLAHSTFLSLLSFSITGLSIFILKYTGKPKYIFVYLIAIIIICNSLKLFVSSATLSDNKVFSIQNIPKIDFQPILKLKPEFHLSKVWENAFRIINLGICPLISLSTSLPYYSNTVGIPVNFNKELLAQGITNGFCSIGLFPTCFNTSGSILFMLCGANSRYHSIFGGLSLIFLFFVYHQVAPLIPSFAISLIFQFIGFTILLGFSKQIISATWLDKALLISIFTVFKISSFNSIVILIFGVILNYLFVYFHTSKDTKLIKKQIDNSMIITVTGSLDFRNVHKIIENSYCNCTDVTFDLSSCDFIDYSANLELEEIMRKLKLNGQKIKICGCPSNLSGKIISMTKEELNMSNSL